MGGSHLAADLIKTWRPDFPLTVWSNYGLPPAPLGVLKKSLLIASSYSGNTEETISAFSEARKKRIPVAAIASGGKLIELAKKFGEPHVKMPDFHVQPRLALGLSMKSLFALMREKSALQEVTKLKDELKPSAYEGRGKNLAKTLRGCAPVIYSSLRNQAIAYNWKIKFNETGKIPAFWNVLPELNHNEMTGFDVRRATESLSAKLHFVFLKDRNDHPRVSRRMQILEKLYRNRGLKVAVLQLEGKSEFLKMFSSLVFADWTTYYTAEIYGVEAEQVPMVEEFKKLIK